MQGGRQATIVVATFAMLSLLMPPLIVLSTAALCLVTLRNGGAEGVKVVIGSTVATSLLGYISLGTPFLSFSYLFIMWLPALVISLVLRETRQLNKALEVLVGLGMLAVIGIYAFVDSPAQQWVTQIQVVVDTISQQESLSVSKTELQTLLEFWSHYITGLVIAGSLTSLMVSLLLGRWWQGLLYNPGGFGEEFSQFRLLQRDAVIFIVLMVVAYLMSDEYAEMIWNLDIQVLLLFLVAGTSVVQAILKAKGKGRFWLLSFYVVLFFVPHLILPLVLIGLSDVWMNWRQRFRTNV